jgi:hypothetical protein
VALSLGLPPPGVTRHPALRSSDFPPALNCAGDRLAAPDTAPYMTTGKKKQAVRLAENPWKTNNCVVESKRFMSFFSKEAYYA